MDSDRISELFHSLRPISVRRMFGGFGIFHDGLMVAIEADGDIWLKADPDSVPFFIDAGSTPFRYRKGEQVVTVSFWRLPEAALDDPEAMAVWSERAVAAARRAVVTRPRRSASDLR
jgi:DNA transformation protein